MEIWKKLENKGDSIYEISSIGRVKNIITGNIIKPGNVNGYYLISGKPKNLGYVHRLVGLTFLPNPFNKPQINHINGIKNDNRIENLEWCTSSENNLHKWKTGLVSEESKKRMYKKGRKSWNKGNCKLSNIQIEEIKSVYSTEKITQKELGKRFGISAFTTNLILNNKITQL